MARYKHKDIEAILKLFEKELMTLNHLSKFEKMKIRKKVANAILPALAMSNSQPDLFLNIVENKLRNVFDLFFDGWGFRERLYKLVDKIFLRNKKTLKNRQAAAGPDG